MAVQEPTLASVRAFWNAHPCNSATSTAADRLRYFREIEEARLAREPHIGEIGRFADFSGRRVLEIGCGLGSDGLRFARAGADYTAVDLSEASLQLARERFTLEGVFGRFIHTNAEQLPFRAGAFDHVYSFGVIHHSPDPPRIVREIQRILAPGGTFCVMLYNRSSINYHIEIRLLRKLARGLLRPSFMPGLLARITGFDRDKLERHRQLWLAGAGQSEEQWLSMNTDGPDCPLARVYNGAEVRALFGGFTKVRTFVRYFDRSHWPAGTRLIPTGLADWLGERWGWHRIVVGEKSS